MRNYTCTYNRLLYNYTQSTYSHGTYFSVDVFSYCERFIPPFKSKCQADCVTVSYDLADEIF